ncbi:probable serine hydrolase [Leptidea sinapis]|uniref:AB hydrolase-1 domain-containing protein n=1 Tax=Leptidea sinapis TaxID=189913 RepID=A0A5E4QZX8_9NEOP|nr:probable serine hydrolase [Leptidea sinapis]VVD03590.1 unnamed protein product [Leptidea sinapis]
MYLNNKFTMMAKRGISSIVHNSINCYIKSISGIRTSQFKSLHTGNVPTKEINIPVQWGHISCKLWGNEHQRPMLALHGWQDNAGTWDPLAPMISDKFPILAIDFMGHGLSSWIPPGLQYYIWDLPRLILTIMNYFKWDKVSLLGHSMGSIAAMRFASTFPDDVDFYIAVDSLIYDDYDLNQVVENFPRILRKLHQVQMLLDKEPPAYTMDEINQKWHLGTNKSVDIESVKYLAQRGVKPSSSDPNKFYFSRDSRYKYTLFNPESKKFVETLIKRLKCPTLYFKGIDSPYASDPYSVEMREVVEKNNPNFECHFVPGTHHVHLNNPERLAPHIIKFLTKYQFIK